MKKLIYISFISGLVFISGIRTQAQIRWDAVLGAGYSDPEIPFSGYGPMELLRGDILVEAGTALSGAFRKEGSLNWQVGLMIQSTGFRSIPPDWEKIWGQQSPDDEIPGILVHDKQDLPRDYNNVYRKRDWGLTMPVSLLYDVFHPVGLIFGADLNYMLSSFPEKDLIKINSAVGAKTEFKDFNIAGHLGLYSDLSPRIRLEGKIFSDIKPRINYMAIHSDEVERGYRRIGFSVDILYKLRP